MPRRAGPGDEDLVPARGRGYHPLHVHIQVTASPWPPDPLPWHAGTRTRRDLRHGDCCGRRDLLAWPAGPGCLWAERQLVTGLAGRCGAPRPTPGGARPARAAAAAQERRRGSGLLVQHRGLRGAAGDGQGRHVRAGLPVRGAWTCDRRRRLPGGAAISAHREAPCASGTPPTPPPAGIAKPRLPRHGLRRLRGHTSALGCPGAGDRASHRGAQPSGGNIALATLLSLPHWAAGIRRIRGHQPLGRGRLGGEPCRARLGAQGRGRRAPGCVPDNRAGHAGDAARERCALRIAAEALPTPHDRRSGTGGPARGALGTTRWVGPQPVLRSPAAMPPIVSCTARESSGSSGVSAWVRSRRSSSICRKLSGST